MTAGTGNLISSTTARVGVGNGVTAEAIGNTDLAAAAGSANRWFQTCTVTIPSNVWTFVAVFGTADGNFTWAEYGIDIGTATVTSSHGVAVLLNRKVAANGVKSAGSSLDRDRDHHDLVTRVLAAFVAVLALFVVSAPAAEAGPKPKPPVVLASYNYVDVPLVDDDGVTRLFGVTTNVQSFSDGTIQVTCTYSVRNEDVTNREAYPVGLSIYEPERVFRLRAPVNRSGSAGGRRGWLHVAGPLRLLHR